jgi:transcriptional regulator of acetoin/glycerol metabolism
MLSEPAPTRPAPTQSAPQTRKPTSDQASFSALVASLKAHDGNLTKAAAALGLTRARAYRLLKAQPDFDLASVRSGAMTGALDE